MISKDTHLVFSIYKVESCLFGRYENVEETHPDIFVKKTSHRFNQISTDQVLEHVTKICKVSVL